MVRHDQDPTRVTACRWRSSSETLDIIEALERIEAVLNAVDARLRLAEAALLREVAEPASATERRGT